MTPRRLDARSVEAVLAKVAEGLSIAAACDAAGVASADRFIHIIKTDPAVRAQYRAVSRHAKSAVKLDWVTLENIFDEVAAGRPLKAYLRSIDIKYKRFHWRVTTDALLAKKYREAVAAGRKARQPSWRPLRHADEIFTRFETTLETLKSICESDSRFPDVRQFWRSLRESPVHLNRYQQALETRADRRRAAVNSKSDAVDVLAIIEKAVPRHHEFRDDLVSEAYLAFVEGRIGADDVAKFVKKLVSKAIGEQRSIASLDAGMGDDGHATLLDFITTDDW